MNETKEQFYLAFKRFATDKQLKDSEKIFLAYVVLNDKGNGLYASNSWFRKELGWKERKTTEVISKLLKKKYIMIQRNCVNSPKRYIFLYNQRTIDIYKNGVLPNNIILDFVE